MTETTTSTVMGKITSVYGVKGWVKVFSYTRPKENLCEYRKWFLQRNGRTESVDVQECKAHGNGLVAKIKGYDDREVAASLRDTLIAIDTDELPSLEDGDYYWHQLVGLKVMTADGDELLGKVSDLMETGSNDVLIVKPCQGSRDGKERLVPYLMDQVVKQIDLQDARIVVDWDPEF